MRWRRAPSFVAGAWRRPFSHALVLMLRSDTASSASSCRRQLALIPSGITPSSDFGRRTCSPYGAAAMGNSAANALSAGISPSSPSVREGSVDLMRGLIIVLMALDHVRIFFTAASFDPLD